MDTSSYLFIYLGVKKNLRLKGLVVGAAKLLLHGTTVTTFTQTFRMANTRVSPGVNVDSGGNDESGQGHRLSKRPCCGKGCG